MIERDELERGDDEWVEFRLQWPQVNRIFFGGQEAAALSLLRVASSLSMSLLS